MPACGAATVATATAGKDSLTDLLTNNSSGRNNAHAVTGTTTDAAAIRMDRRFILNLLKGQNQTDPRPKRPRHRTPAPDTSGRNGELDEAHTEWLRALQKNYEMFIGRCHCTVNVPSTRMSSDDAPTITLNSPGSTTRCMSRLRSDRPSRGMTKWTVLVSPALRATRSKPRRFFS